MAYLVIFPLLFARLQTPPTTDVRRAPNVRSQESLIHRNISLAVQNFTLIFAHDIMMDHAKTLKWYLLC